MKTSKAGIDLIKKFEGCRLKAYKCAAGVWTIGYGHTKGVKANDTITQEKAEEMLLSDIAKYEANVNSFKNYNFNQNQYDALVSFAFNVGSINQLTNNGKRSIYQIAQHIQAYVYAGGKKLQGLINRRKAEYQLFNTPVKATATASTVKHGYTINKTYKTVVSNLQIREAASATAKAVGKFKKGSNVKVLDAVLDAKGNTWVKHSKGYSAAIYNGKTYIK